MSLEVRATIEVGTPDGESTIRLAATETVIEPDIHSVDGAFDLAKHTLDQMLDHLRAKGMEQLDQAVERWRASQ
jgi:hypothetical protein